MSLYLIGDIQGCFKPFEALLEKIAFNPSKDTVYILGDLVNRGPDSLKVLRKLKSLDGAARCVLGNHDLHLLSVAHGVRQQQDADTLDDILHAPDKNSLIAWLREQPLAIYEHQTLMLHAGVLPQWHLKDTLDRAQEVHDALISPDHVHWLKNMYGPAVNAWTDSISDVDRWRTMVNAFTRLRFCTPEGKMDFKAKEGASSAPQGLVPWFDAPNRQTHPITIAFGHWSTLGWLERGNLISLDSGCVWGGCLSAYPIDNAPLSKNRLIQIRCNGNSP